MGWIVVAALVCAWIAWMVVRMVNGQLWLLMAGGLVGATIGASFGRAMT